MSYKAQTFDGREVYGAHIKKPATYRHYIVINGGCEEVEVRGETVKRFFGNDKNGAELYIGDPVIDGDATYELTAEHDARYVHKNCEKAPF